MSKIHAVRVRTQVHGILRHEVEYDWKRRMWVNTTLNKRVDEGNFKMNVLPNVIEVELGPLKLTPSQWRECGFPIILTDEEVETARVYFGKAVNKV